MRTEERIGRMSQINELIVYIGSVDKNRYKPLLHNKNENGGFDPGSFTFAPNGLLYYLDSYTKQPIRPIESASSQRESRFSSGGNMWWLVLSFAQFIMTGYPGSLRDYKEIWAFDLESTMLVRRRAKEIGFITTVDYPHHLYKAN